MNSLNLLIFFLIGVNVAFGGVFRSNKDVEKFRQYLENSVHGKHREPLTLDLAERQNEWERSGKFEGDIVLTKDQIEALVNDYAGSRNAILNANKLWTGNVLYYTISSSLSATQKAAIEDGLKDLAKVSCLTFKEKTSTTKNYVQVLGGSGGCFSSVGMVGGGQTLNLAPSNPGSGCFRHGTIVHEFLHALGFYHMQSTFDRDEFIKVNWDKIQPGTEHNFNKYTSSQVTNFDVVYDYGSVLHYSEYGFSIDGSKTLEPIKPTNETIGQRIGMSPGDIRKLNKLYKCID